MEDDYTSDLSFSREFQLSNPHRMAQIAIRYLS